MSDHVLVVGAGLAGLSAAVELARAGLPVLVVDQAQAAGGAIHRQPLPGGRSLATPVQEQRWSDLMAQVAAQGSRITLALATRFGGVDHTGTALLSGGMNRLLRPRAVVLALGARETVRPRPGWTLPGVETAGSLQIRLKTLGEAPQGRVLLAGSGPLLLAVGAQLTKLGSPPVAILEAGRPFARPLTALGLPRDYWIEAAGYLSRLMLARVPILTDTRLTAIRAENGALMAEASNGRRFVADHVALHDGIRPNDLGLPICDALPVVQLGDCREALGARAAMVDGQTGGAALAARLLGQKAPSPDPELARQRRAQARLADLYAHDVRADLNDLPGDTVICRCEERTLNDLRALGPAPTARQLRLDGRFAMGPCQGRFCGDWIARLTSAQAIKPGIGAPRWPARPIAVADLLAATDETEGENP